MPIDYLQKILTAKVYDVAIEIAARARADPVAPARQPRAARSARTSSRCSRSSCAARTTRWRTCRAAERARGVIAASAGNHAQGVALAAQRLGCQATIVMPVTTPHIKVAAVEARGAKVVLHGDSYATPTRRRCALQKKSRATFVHPYDDPDVIAGQGTIGMEILRQWQGPLDAIFVAIGGGGLIAGIAAYVKRVRPEVKVIGVQPVDSDAMARSLAAGRRVDAAARRAVRRRRRGEAGRQGNVPHRARARRRDRAGRHRRDLRRDQGRVRGHALDPRAGRRAGDRRRQGVGRAAPRDGTRRSSRSPAART